MCFSVPTNRSFVTLQYPLDQPATIPLLNLPLGHHDTTRSRHNQRIIPQSGTLLQNPLLVHQRIPHHQPTPQKQFRPGNLFRTRCRSERGRTNTTGSCTGCGIAVVVGGHGGHLEQSQRFRNILPVHIITQSHLGQTLTDPNQCFQLPHGNRNRGRTPTLQIGSSYPIPDFNVGGSQHLPGILRKTGGARFPRVLDVFLHGGDLELSPHDRHPCRILRDTVRIGFSSGGVRVAGGGGVDVARGESVIDHVFRGDHGGLGSHGATGEIPVGIHVHPHDMLANHRIPSLIPHVSHQKHHIEPTQNSGH
mmetsp:Transcript_36096/g.41855  ORF Transcript_36096/g.41855 Transcript_36096/m.41855 type:complete len:306 (-) Transcript_36096:238-1155(-)